MSAQCPGSRALRRLALSVAAFTVLAGAATLRLAAEGPEASAAVLEEFRAYCAEIHDGDDPFYGRGQIRELVRRLQQDPLTEAERIAAERSLAEHLLRMGDSREAFELLNKTLQRAVESDRPKLEQIQILSRVGLAAMRVGEVTNCVGDHRPGMCILPIGPAGRHRDPQGSQLAIRAFTSVLSGAPDFPVVPWLLNIAAMTVGQYPDAVPDGYRVPPERMQSSYDIGRFPDIASMVGLHIRDVAGGAAMDDFDGDGRLDLITTSAEPCAPSRFFVQDAAGAFTARSDESDLASQLGALNLIHADYDNDGDLDVFLLRGAWMGERGRVRNSLLRNDLSSSGRFVDVTRAAGLAEPALPTQTGAWADYDLDGDLDLYVGNEGMPPDTAFPSQLFRNRGDGTFEDVTARAGVENRRIAKAVAWGDANGDGYPDLYVSNIGPNRLYINRGDGTFEDRAVELGVTEPAVQSFGSFFFDLDNDGDQDLLVTSYEIGPLEITDYFVHGKDSTRGRPYLYRNDGAGRFEEVGVEFGLTQPTAPMGHNYGDLDNDGFLDFYLGTGQPSYESLMPNLMYRNNGGRGFQDVTYSGGFGHLQKGHGVAFGDFDDDGDQDVFEMMGGGYPGDAYPSVLYENPGHGNRWLKLRLEGVSSNRSGVGARVKVLVEGPAGPRVVYRTAGGNGSFGSSPLRVELGLGNVTAIREVEILWPRSGTLAERVERLGALELDSHYRVREGEGARLVERSARRSGNAPLDHHHRAPDKSP